MTDIFAKFQTNQGDIGRYMKKAHGYFAFPKLEGEIAPYMNFRGKRMLTWSLNNYLGLANHPEVRKADAEAAAKWGLAYPMGPVRCRGKRSGAEKGEGKLAAHVGKEWLSCSIWVPGWCRLLTRHAPQRRDRLRCRITRLYP